MCLFLAPLPTETCCGAEQGFRSTEISIFLSARIVGCVLHLVVRAAVDPQLGASLLLTALQMGWGVSEACSLVRVLQEANTYLGLGIWLGS